MNPHLFPHSFAAMKNLHQGAVEEREFHFWSGNRFRDHLKNGRLGLHRPLRTLSDDSGDDPYTPSSPLLPLRHHCSRFSLSPSSRTRAIEQGRKELMEMIHDLPESSFELSLKDIVVEQRNSDGDAHKAEESAIEEKGLELIEQKRKRRKKANTKPRICQVSRCSSMDSGVFLIKLFLPSFLTSKKTSSKPGNQSKVLSQENHVVTKESSLVVELQSSKNCRSKTSGIRSLSSSCRKDNGESVPGCCPFDIGKPKIRRQKTCVF